MASLKTAMHWDEETFGLEYDLDVFNIVAVSDFNMGAMENKGLNIFNTRYVLAKPETATDIDYQGIEAVIAHEYFHNWTGDRVTCRDWFQLSLKEGLTVFRDQEFSADQGSRAVRRIGDVRTPARRRNSPRMPGRSPIRCSRRAICGSTISTPRPSTTRAPKLIRMIHTLLGRDGFRRGMDLYIERHDNHAATIEDFVAAMQDASGVDLGRLPLLVPPGRHARDHRRGPLRRGGAQLRADRRAEDAADPGPAREAADADPAGDGPDRPERRRTADPARRRGRGARPARGVLVCERGAPDLPLCRCAGAAGAVAAARLLGAGEAAGRAARAAEIPRDPRHRPVRPLGRRAAGRDPQCCSTGSAPAQRGEALPPLDADLVAAMRADPRRCRRAIRPSPPRR